MLYDLGLKVKDCILNASPQPLDVATSNFVGA